MKCFKKLAAALGVCLFWLLLWQAAAIALDNSLIFPSPFETAKRLSELAVKSEFWRFTALSLLRVIIGIAAAIPTAVLFSAVCSASRTAGRLFAPAVVLMRSTPVVSFILIAIFIFEREIIPSAITFMMVFPVLYQNLREGISQTSAELLEMAGVFRISWFLKLKRIYAPAVMPYFFSALTTSVGLAMKAGIAAEVVAYIPDSIGKKLSDAKSYMEPADLLAWTAVIIILSLLIEKAVCYLISLSGRRRRNVSDKGTL